MIIVDVFVPGAAKTKGSMEVRNRATGAMKESVVGSSRWRVLMAQAVRDNIVRRTELYDGYRPEYCMPKLPYPGAVAVTVAAYLAPPDAWRLSALWAFWTRAGDLDKIVRNVLDALGSTADNPKYNGGAIVDDNLVCRLVAEKHVADDRHPAGARIIVETL